MLPHKAAGMPLDSKTAQVPLQVSALCPQQQMCSLSRKPHARQHCCSPTLQFWYVNVVQHMCCVLLAFILFFDLPKYSYLNIDALWKDAEKELVMSGIPSTNDSITSNELHATATQC